ncbi:MAG: hypothetical protein JWO82_1792, partial [Akkermansiaceae bacterium]|nr:hypothetical protein [Akkermansiaceae bacterium]
MSRPRRVAPRPSGAPPTRIVVVKQGGGGAGTTAGLLVLALVIGAGGWAFYQKSQNDKPKTENKQVVVEDGSKKLAGPSADQFPATETKNTGEGMKFIAPEKVTEQKPAETNGGTATPYGGKQRPTIKTNEGVSNDGSPESVAAAAVSAELDREDMLSVLGIDAQKQASKKREADLFDRAMKVGAWQGYQELLMRSLSGNINKVRQGEGRGRYDALWAEQVFYQDFLQWQILNRFQPGDIGYSEKSRGLMTWLLKNNDAMEETLLTVKQGDNKKKVIAMLADCHAENPDQFGKYFNLALACSVVFDQTVSIPAASSAHDFPSTVDPMARYHWYIEKNEKGKLLSPVDRSTARDLVWVVCAPVPDSELDWAIDKMHLSRKGWGATYDKVEYLMERAVKGTNPYDEYTLAEILKKGGICGDRSYFCVNTARAHGIPAMTIGGETDLGGHAWAGVKIRDDEWTTLVGRIGGAANGKADNPQLGGQISEQEIWLWNDRAQQSAVATKGVFRCLWLADFLEIVDQQKEAETAVTQANTIGRPFSETWLRVYDQLVGRTERAENKAAPEIVDAWVAFVAEMRNEFRENPRMAELATKAESTYIFPNIPAEEARKA